jgi:hypothetical protein
VPFSVALQASDKDRFLRNWTKPQHMWSTKAQLNEAEAQKAAKKAKEQADKLQPAPPAQKEPQAEVPTPQSTPPAADVSPVEVSHVVAHPTGRRAAVPGPWLHPPSGLSRTSQWCSCALHGAGVCEVGRASMPLLSPSRA